MGRGKYATMFGVNWKGGISREFAQRMLEFDESVRTGQEDPKHRRLRVNPDQIGEGCLPTGRVALVTGRDDLRPVSFIDVRIDAALDDSMWNEGGPLHCVADKFPRSKQRTALVAVANAILEHNLDQQLHANDTSDKGLRRFSKNAYEQRITEALERQGIKARGRLRSKVRTFYAETARTLITILTSQEGPWTKHRRGNH